MVPILPAAAYDDDASVVERLANQRKGGIIWTAWIHVGIFMGIKKQGCKKLLKPCKKIKPSRK